eukprot:9629325-Alexandrium_andersonii.AAC.1
MDKADQAHKLANRRMFRIALLDLSRPVSHWSMSVGGGGLLPPRTPPTGASGVGSLTGGAAALSVWGVRGGGGGPPFQRIVAPSVS